MPLFRILLPLLLLTSFFLLSTNTYAQTDGKYVAIRLLPSQTQVQGGETITVGIEQTIYKGWHTYWKNPGDSGSVVRIAWKGLDGIQPGDIEWPVPERLPMGPLTNFGYEDNVVLLQDITVPKHISQAPVTLTADIDILVCNEICIPETHTASFILNGDEDPVPAAVEKARSHLPVPLGWETNMRAKDGHIVIDVRTDSPESFAKTATIELYPEEWGIISNPAATKSRIEDGKLVLTHAAGERRLNDIPPSHIVIAYEDASGARKGVRLSVVGDGAIPAATVVPDSSVGIAQAFLFALIGGLILNLMPCVFPVLSMKAMSLVSLQDKDLGKARLHGLAYTFGILLSFGVIAGALIALKAGGAQIGWGFQLQNPAIILFLAYLFFTLGLNLMGYFDIRFGLANAGESLTRKDGVSGSFFTGVLATLVATPCTAPFMGVAMGFALTQPALISLGVFLALGLGLALPYLVLTFVPALRHKLPKPGHWMETFRQFLAFPMFASACWLVWVLSQQTDHMGVFLGLLGMLSIVFGLWLYKRNPAKNGIRIALRALAIAAFAFTAFTLVLDRHVDPRQIGDVPSGENWQAFSQNALDDHLKAGRAVFVNMTAAWCITCKVNEKVALSTASTEKLFADRNIVYLKGDWTNQNPEITKFLESYGRSGVPLYVYYGPRAEDTGTQPEAVVLPQILTPAIVEKTILGE